MIPGVQTFHPRESWTDPRYPITGPVDNPANNDTVVIHYTAADNLIDGDPGEHASNLPAYMRAMQRSYVENRGYSLGYLFAVDWLGGVWQIRGWDIQSAANKGHNDHTWPVLVLVDGDDEATNEAVASIRAIVAEAERRAGRSQTVVGHRDIGSTSCPGAGLYRQVKDGTFVPTGNIPQPPTPPPTPVGEDVLVNIVYYNNEPAHYAQYSGGYKIWIPDEATEKVLLGLNPGMKATSLNATWMQAAGPILPGTPLPYNGAVDAYGRRT